MSVQIITEEQAEAFKFNPFDPTKLWSQDEYPLHEIGRMTMNRNVQSHWDETEQALFSPGNFVPGIRPSPDKVLAGRILAYNDAQNFRLGANRHHLPINRPLNSVANYQGAGRAVYLSQGAAPIHFPNSFGGPVESERARELDPPYKQCGLIRRYEDDGFDNDHFTQPREFWRHVLDDDHRTRVVKSIARLLRMVSDKVRERSIKMLGNVDEEISERLRKELDGLDIEKRC